MTVKNSDIIHDYFYDFKNIKKDKSLLVLLIFFICLVAFLQVIDSVSKRNVYLIPMWFAYLSMYTHKLSLPAMMYLVPVSAEEKKKYIGKMAVCKIAVPLIFMIVYDLIMAFFVNFGIWDAAVQLCSVLLPCVSSSINFESYYAQKMEIGTGLYQTPSALGAIYFIYPFRNNTALIPIILLLILYAASLCSSARKWPHLRELYSCYESIDSRGEKK